MATTQEASSQMVRHLAPADLHPILSPATDHEIEIAARALADADCAGLRSSGIMVEPKNWRVFEADARRALEAFLAARIERLSDKAGKVDA